MENLGAKNRRKNLLKQPGPPFQIREGPGCFSIAEFSVNTYIQSNLKMFLKPVTCIQVLKTPLVELGNKERFDMEQIGIKEPFPVTNSPFTS